jgi:hypothetical protein
MDIAGLSLTGASAPSTSMRVKSAPSPSKSFAAVSNDGRQPTSMSRARVWSPEVENAYRIQLAGFKDMTEYLSVHPEPELWENSLFYKCLRAKATGFYLYFRSHRECLDKDLPKVKIYQY